MLAAMRRPAWTNRCSSMFSVSDTEAAAIRAAYERGGELAAAVELRRYFRGIDSTAKAREYARIIAGWKPLPKLPAAALTQRRNAAQAQEKAPAEPGPRSCRRLRE